MAKPDEPRSFEGQASDDGEEIPPYAAQPGQEMMGDGTEEQNLGQTGDPSARITRDEVEQAFRDEGVSRR